MRVRTNADTPADAARAVELGAEGIGLCRTEHMFFDTPDRRLAMQEMIVADSAEERRLALDKLQPFQEKDFLKTYWEAATPLEKILTLILSKEDRTYGLKEIRQLLAKQTQIKPSARATKEALDQLVEMRSIFKRSSEGGYAFAVEAFPQMLISTTTYEDLLEVLIEQYEQPEG